MKKSGKSSDFLLILILLLGLSLLLYPGISNAWNARYQTRAIESYAIGISNMNDQQYDTILRSAAAYNQSLLGRTNRYTLDEEQRAAYDSELNFQGDGIMGYIEIPTIGCTLPIYHGTSEAVLQIAVGHLDWTSLPTGGESTHCVLSGHRGLPSARLFTDLDQLQEGDVFMLRILDEVLTYEVDQIKIVLPHETEALLIEEGKDLCTLVTCTPYGVNSHRLLVRGHRVESAVQSVTLRVTADALQMEPLAVAGILFFPILSLLLLVSAIFEKLLNTTGTKPSGRKNNDDF